MTEEELQPEEETADQEGLTAVTPGPHLIFAAPKPPTPTQVIRHFAYWLVLNIFGLVVAAAIVSFAWNALETLHQLPTIDFHQAFAILVLVRVLAFTVRH